MLSAFVSAFALAQNNALDFDGVDDYVEINSPTGYLAGSVFTIELWYKPGAQTEHKQTLISRGSGNSFWEIINNGKWNNASGIVFYHPIAPFVEDFCSMPYDFSVLNQWHHVAVTSDGTWLKIYHDGKFISEDRVNGPLGTVTGPIRLGASTGFVSNYSPAYDGGYFNGAMDEVRIWNVARTAEEILADQNREVSPATDGLIAYYNFNQGTAAGANNGITSLTDASVSTVNGTLNNFALTGATSNFVSGFPLASVLPVKLVAFEAHKKGSASEVSWVTAQEENLRLFEVERSGDAQHFAKIGTVTPKGGGTGSSYVYVDNLATGDINYYRLRSVDNDGLASLSSIVSVKPGAKEQLTIYPNPMHNTAIVHITNFAKGPYKLFVFDLSGHVVLQKTISFTGNNQQTELSLQNVAAGTYLLTIEGPGIKAIQTILQKQ